MTTPQDLRDELRLLRHPPGTAGRDLEEWLAAKRRKDAAAAQATTRATTMRFQAAPRGRRQSSAGDQYLCLLRARASLQLAHEQTHRPQVRAAAADAIAKVNMVIRRVEGRPPAR